MVTIIPASPVECINLAAAKNFVRTWHYSKIFPPHCLLNLAQRDESGKIAAVSMWGYGVRPRHTIQRLFPSLDTGDYFELNRLCLRDELPRNSESHFLSLCADWIRTHKPNIQLLFSWADGLRGKPGYVYQASSWLYGGFIKTEIYLDAEGGPVHPRLMITRLGTRCRTEWLRQGFSKWWGYQFRYCKFLCGHKKRKKLLKESPFDWSNKYPKFLDCRWWHDAGEGSRESRDPPKVEGTGQFRHPALDFEVQNTQLLF
ncbi:MAG: hypothetical protein ACRC2T_17830 [Thermoguttaceae bacterium]